jgi:uncharacterized protein YciW
MTSSTHRSQKPLTAAQRASVANRAAQMTINAQLGRPTPEPRDPNVTRESRESHDDRHRGRAHSR